ncbi:ribonuclease H-like domain-containing protein [Rhizophagus clarus]|uniref:Ribonuclease H-like domain-containing protein n=1 Tax=Rhizophagus clarus TaxID=94130 RepID=A0A8H3QI00_9GLOM|nr:ribonuclease H-like domain-containing protein [Rhizophagus clarus]
MLYKRTGGNTTNLHKHLQMKHPSKVETEVESGEIDKFVKKELPHYTQGIFQDFTVRWIICNNQPFTAVKSEHLRLLFCILNPIAKAPSADTLHNNIINKFNEERNKIREILQNVPEILINFCKLSGPHSEENLHEVFVKCCDDMRIPTKIMACTTDNASNNDTLMKALEKTSQDALSTLKVRYVENENKLLNNDEVSEIIPKLRKLVIKIHVSPQRREKFSRQCEAAHLPNKELVIFLHDTLHISHGRYPTIENSIPIFNWLMDKIKDFDKKIGIDEIVKQEARNAMEKLKKYYQYTDGMIYTISTILDLWLKLTYHRDHNWEEKYITEARDDIKNLYNTIYAPRNESKLDLYLGSLANESQYPHLAAMACDYLAIPATNTPIERAFSGGTDLISQKRCSLLSETIRACMCLKSWWKTELKK